MERLSLPPVRSRVNARRRQYFSENPEAREKRGREFTEWAKAHPEKQRERAKKYQGSPKGKRAKLASEHRRRARKKSLLATFTSTEAKFATEFFEGKCAYCGTSLSNTRATFDHVKPVSKKGPMVAENMVPACASCNSSKNGSDLSEWLQKRTDLNTREVKTRLRHYRKAVSERFDGLD